MSDLVTNERMPCVFIWCPVGAQVSKLSWQNELEKFGCYSNLYMELYSFMALIIYGL